VLNTPIKRASLDDAYDASLVAPAVTLRVKLRSYETAARTRISSGQLIASTSANGHSTSFSTPGSDGLSPSEVVELWRELIDLHDQVKTDIGGSPSDAVVKAEMMARLVPCFESEGDFSALRCVG
jgi:hypothetical protein